MLVWPSTQFRIVHTVVPLAFDNLSHLDPQDCHFDSLLLEHDQIPFFKIVNEQSMTFPY